jgi:hypothetical protein
MDILNKEQIKEIRWALENINYEHWMNNRSYGYSYLNKYPDLNKAGIILYNNSIYKINTKDKVEEYLNMCEKINYLLDFIYQNNLSINQVKNIFNSIITYIQNNIGKEKKRYEQIIKDLDDKNVKDIIVDNKN